MTLRQGNRENMTSIEAVSFNDFLNEWLRDIEQDSPSTTELGHRFAHKLITQWLDTDDAGDDIIYCDGAGDGGIDLACLQRGDADSDTSVEGDRWYLIQSKYGKAFQGISTLLEESYKVIGTLGGHRHRLSSLAEDLQKRLSIFRRQASELDRIVLVFATTEPLNDEQKRALEGIRAMGREALGGLFDVEAVSVADIYQRNSEQDQEQRSVHVPIKANMTFSGDDLLVGAIALNDLYDFLKEYRNQTQDIDQIYEKNVRKFLGSRRKVNKTMRDTLINAPENFGLFNNGITIVVNEFEERDDVYDLVAPFIVNGCQTTRTIWDVCEQRLNAGGTGTDPEIEDWKMRLSNGVVVAKIVRIGHRGDELLLDITRYTNSQNAISEKDFLTLRQDFKVWAQNMADNYDIFLEIQRGGWESQRAYQRQHPAARKFIHKANAFDLVKVYGSGWKSKAGLAFGKNSAFLPDGRVFKEIMEENGGTRFGERDLYAAYLLQIGADDYGFGRSAEKASRR